VDANGERRALHFYLAGINNQNFLMRDKETGTWWQQITARPSTARCKAQRSNSSSATNSPS